MVYTLTIRFKDLRPQEIRFRREPESFFVVNNAEEEPEGCTAWVNGKRYCTFVVPCGGWG